MSILDSLKLLNKPINELAMLPQQTIIQLSQSHPREFPPAYVSAVLGQKAEQAKAGAQAAAMMQQKQLPPSTVIERVIAENAASEAGSEMGMPPRVDAPVETPMMQMPPQPEPPLMPPQMPPGDPMAEAGLASLPISEAAIPAQYAGGGIIAFDNGGEVQRFQNQGLVDSKFDYSKYGDEGAQLKLLEELKSSYLGKDQSAEDLTKYIKDAEKRAASDADRAFYNRIFKAGMNILGGTSPDPFVNIGKGAAPEIEGYMGDMDKQRASELERKKTLAELQGKGRTERVATLGSALTRAEDFRKAKFSKEKFEAEQRQGKEQFDAEQRQARDSLRSKEIQAAADRANRLRIAETPGETERIAETIMAESEEQGQQITYEEAARRAKNALTAPPDRYNALSNRLNSANKDFTTRTFMLQQLLATSPESKKKAIINEIENIKKQVYIDYSITSADLAELQAHRNTGTPTPTSTTKPPPITRSADGKFRVVTPDGQTFSFPNQQAAEQFNSQIKR